MSDLREAALGCLFPGFEGLEPPDWIRRRLGDGLGGVVLYARNVETLEQLAALNVVLHTERGEVLVSIDEEGGDVTRLEAESGSSYPGNAALGAVDDTELTEEVASALGAELAQVGIDLDLAPVADVNSNAANPIIGIRSFGSEPDLVARHVAAFVRGLQSAGVAACAKHFPGHGDAEADSHLELPTIHVDREKLLTRELVPFRAAIEAGARSLMTAHIVVPALDDAPATTSRAILTDLLRGELGFEGMVMTDALEMRAVSGTIGVEEGAVRALAAGADALCLGHDLGDESVESIIRAVTAAVESGRLREERLVEACERVRRVAKWAERPVRAEAAPRGVGAEAAHRAITSEGPVELSRPALVLELATKPSIAAGPTPGPGQWLQRALPGARLVQLAPGGRIDDVERSSSEQVVVVARDAHRHAWQREVVEGLLAADRDAIVVEVGLPYWRPADGTAFVATYGAARVNLEAAAKLLSGSAILPVATRGGAVR